MENYLENHVISFSHLLRRNGVNIGSSEIIDALRGLTAVNIADRDQFYKTLACLLVKGDADLHLFDDAFQVYFAPESVRGAELEQYLKRREETDALQEELTFRDDPIKLSRTDMDLYASLPEESRQKIRDFVTKTDEGYLVGERHRVLLERNIRGALEYYRNRMDGTVISIESTGDDEWDAMLYEMARRKDDEELLFKDMASIRDEELRDSVVLVRQLARRLATRIGRRYKQSSKATAVDVRRSLRHSAGRGGVLMELKYRRRRVQKPSIVLLADISGSMIKYSRFVILMMLGLRDALPNLHSFAFADHLAPLDLQRFKAEDFSAIPGIGEGTDLHTALMELERDHHGLLGRRTVIVILSDTKSRSYREAAWLLEGISGRVKEILWLNPMEEEEWSRYTMVEAFLPHVTMYEASSLDKLARALRRI